MTDSEPGVQRPHLAAADVPSRDRSASPLDPQSIERLRELDPGEQLGVLQRVLSAYRVSLGRHLDDIAEAFAQSDRPRLLRAAHTLKSSSAAVGALDLSALCADLEREAGDSSRPPVDTGVEALIHEGRRVLVAVGAMLDA